MNIKIYDLQNNINNWNKIINKVNLKDIAEKVAKKHVNYNHFIDSKSSMQQKQENQFNLIKVNLKFIPKAVLLLKILNKRN